jgi:invasion protein IalB
VAGHSSATVSFTAPAADGGSAINSYTVTSSPGGVTASGIASPITVNGLTNGTTYTFTVTATNAHGTGPASAPSNSVTPS